jgi:hypothetical protein
VEARGAEKKKELTLGGATRGKKKRFKRTHGGARELSMDKERQGERRNERIVAAAREYD